MSEPHELPEAVATVAVTVLSLVQQMEKLMFLVGRAAGHARLGHDKRPPPGVDPEGPWSIWRRERRPRLRCGCAGEHDLAAVRVVTDAGVASMAVKTPRERGAQASKKPTWSAVAVVAASRSRRGRRARACERRESVGVPAARRGRWRARRRSGNFEPTCASTQDAKHRAPGAASPVTAAVLDEVRSGRALLDPALRERDAQGLDPPGDGRDLLQPGLAPQAVRDREPLLPVEEGVELGAETCPRSAARGSPAHASRGQLHPRRAGRTPVHGAGVEVLLEDVVAAEQPLGVLDVLPPHVGRRQVEYAPH